MSRNYSLVFWAPNLLRVNCQWYQQS